MRVALPFLFALACLAASPGCKSAPQAVAPVDDGPAPLSLVYFANVNGEIEPCG